MPNIVNVSLVNSVKEEFNGVNSILLFNYQGMGLKRESFLRSQINKVTGKMLVVKNSAAANAFKGTALEGAVQYLNGPIAILYGGNDIVDVAKATQKYLEEFEGEKNVGSFVGGVLEGEAIDGAVATSVHKMFTKKDAQAHIVGLALGPGSKIAGILKAIIEKGEEAAKAG